MFPTEKEGGNIVKDKSMKNKGRRAEGVAAEKNKAWRADGQRQRRTDK